VNEPQLVAALRSAGCVFAEDEARILVAEATSPAELMAWTARRMAGEPLEQVVGWASFAGLRIAVDPGVFVPRRRSELLVAAAGREPATVVVDLCCGTGALGAALSARWPEAEVHAADSDPVAVACARRNLPPERVHEGDLYDALPGELRGRVDLLVVNAPYVPTGRSRRCRERPATTSTGSPSTGAPTGSTCSGGWLPAPPDGCVRVGGC